MDDPQTGLVQTYIKWRKIGAHFGPIDQLRDLLRRSGRASVRHRCHFQHQGAESGFDLIATHSALPSRVAQQLAEEERDLSLLFSKYKEEKLQELAGLLAHKTLQMGSSVRRRSRSKF